MQMAGQIGEEIAAKYLQDKGFKILGRNYHLRPYGEIDIVARAIDGTLCFVEVKTVVESDSGFVAEDHVGKAKLDKMKRMGELFSAKHPELVREERGWRLDVLAITIPAGIRQEELTKNVISVIINTYENVS